MKRLEVLAYDNTLFSERLERRAGDGIFQKGEICALITHTCHFILSSSALAPDTAFTLKMCCYPYGRGGKNESVPLLSSENLILTGAGLLFIFHLTKPIFFSSHTSSICRPSLQQSQMPAKQTAVGGESSVAGISSLYSAGGQPVKHGEDRESNFLSSKLLPLLISKEGS